MPKKLEVLLVLSGDKCLIDHREKYEWDRM